MVTVAMTSEAREQFSELPSLIAVRVEKLLARLNRWPDVSGVKHLRGNLAGKCRLRTGDYRLQFHVQEKKTAVKAKQTGKATKERETIDYIVVVEKIGHRDGFYED